MNKIKLSHVLIFSSLLFIASEVFIGYYYRFDATKINGFFVSLFLFFVLVIYFLNNKKYSEIKFNRIRLLLFFLFAFLFIVGFFWNFRVDTVRYDISLIFRSLFLGFFVYKISQLINIKEREKTLRVIALVTWMFVGISIVSSAIFDYGMHTYEEFNSGYKFFFPSLNELNFVYLSSFVVLFFLSSGFHKRFFLLLSTLVVFVFIGNKSYIPLMVVIFFSYFFSGLNKKTKLIIILSSLVFCIFVFIFSDFFSFVFSSLIYYLVFILTNFSLGAEKLLIKLSYLSPFSALISERDMLFMMVVDVFNNYANIANWFFGLGFGNYGNLYGEVRGEGFSFSEMDIVDLFMAYGIFGVILFSFFMYSFLKDSNSEWYSVRFTLVSLFVFNGILTGHVYFMGFTIFYFCCYLGLLSSEK